MSTLLRKDYELMDKQIQESKGKQISKERILLILHNKLKSIDEKNDLIVDRIDGAVVKELINQINSLSE